MARMVLGVGYEPRDASGNIPLCVMCKRQPHASFFPFAPFAGHPRSSPFSRHLFALFSPFCSVERRAHYRAWRGAVSGWSSPKTSGRKFLPEICVKKGQHWILVKKCPEFSCNFLRIFRVFPGKRTPLRFTKNSRHSSMLNPQSNP